MLARARSFTVAHFRAETEMVIQTYQNTLSREQRYEQSQAYGIIQKGHVLEEFKESEEIKGIISTLRSIHNDQIAVELALERCLCESSLYLWDHVIN